MYSARSTFAGDDSTGGDSLAELEEMIELTEDPGKENETSRTPESENRRAADSLDELTEPVVWDVNPIDKLLYIATPIILLVSASALLLIVHPLTPPRKSMTCNYPPPWNTTHELAAARQCLSSSTIYQIMYDPLEGPKTKKIELNTFTPTESYPGPPVVSKLILMALLCVAPLLLWRILGVNADISQFLSTTSGKKKLRRDQLSNTFTIITYMLSKMAALAVGAVLLFLFSRVMANIDLYLEKYDFYRRTINFTVFCDYKMRVPNLNTHNYSLQCMVSSGGGDSGFDGVHALKPMMASLNTWLWGLVIVQVVNAVVILGLFVVSFSSSIRSNFIRRHVNGAEPAALLERFDSAVDSSACFVGLLSVRNGHTQGFRGMLSATRRQLVTSITKGH